MLKELDDPYGIPAELSFRGLEGLMLCRPAAAPVVKHWFDFGTEVSRKVGADAAPLRNYALWFEMIRGRFAPAAKRPP